MSLSIDIKCPICGEVLNVGFVAHMMQMHRYEPMAARELYLRTVNSECACAAVLFGGLEDGQGASSI